VPPTIASYLTAVSGGNADEAAGTERKILVPGCAFVGSAARRRWPAG